MQVLTLKTTKSIILTKSIQMFVHLFNKFMDKFDKTFIDFNQVVNI